MPDGALATSGGLSNPGEIAVSRQGVLYLAEGQAHRVRRVTQDGIISRVAGTEAPGPTVPGELPGRTQLYWPDALAFGPEGALYFGNNALFRIALGSLERPIGPSELLVTSREGDEAYVFDSSGRHLRTLNATTGALLYQFSYALGGLSQVTDRFGNTTRLERNGQGLLTAIIAPGGQRTSIQLDAAGLTSRRRRP